MLSVSSLQAGPESESASVLVKTESGSGAADAIETSSNCWNLGSGFFATVPDSEADPRGASFEGGASPLAGEGATQVSVAVEPEPEAALAPVARVTERAAVIGDVENGDTMGNDIMNLGSIFVSNAGNGEAEDTAISPEAFCFLLVGDDGTEQIHGTGSVVIAESEPTTDPSFALRLVPAPAEREPAAAAPTKTKKKRLMNCGTYRFHIQTWANQRQCPKAPTFLLLATIRPIQQLTRTKTG
jgi:hypothetical protein